MDPRIAAQIKLAAAGTAEAKIEMADPKSGEPKSDKKTAFDMLPKPDVANNYLYNPLFAPPTPTKYPPGFSGGPSQNYAPSTGTGGPTWSYSRNGDPSTSKPGDKRDKSKPAEGR